MPSSSSVGLLERPPLPKMGLSAVILSPLHCQGNCPQTVGSLPPAAALRTPFHCLLSARPWNSAAFRLRLR